MNKIYLKLPAAAYQRLIKVVTMAEFQLTIILGTTLDCQIAAYFSGKQLPRHWSVNQKGIAVKLGKEEKKWYYTPIIPDKLQIF